MLAPTLSADARAALDDAAQLAASLGHHVEPVTLGIDFEAVRHAFLMLCSVTTRDMVLNAERITGRKPMRDEFEIATWAMAQIGRKLGERELPAALEEQRRITVKLTDLLSRYDVILCATLGIRADQDRRDAADPERTHADARGQRDAASNRC